MYHKYEFARKWKFFISFSLAFSVQIINRVLQGLLNFEHPNQCSIRSEIIELVNFIALPELLMAVAVIYLKKQ